MPRRTKKQYTEIKNRTIFVIKNPLTKEFFVGHARSDRLRPTYKDHYIGSRYKTSPMISDLREKGLKPCFFALESLDSTAVQAYRHVVVWTKFFLEHGFTNLDHGNVIYYAKDLLPENEILYEKIKDTDLAEIFDCKKCLFPNYGRVMCPLVESEKDN